MDAHKERVWFDDLHGFVEPHNLVKFFPMKDMSFAEQLNAVLRFSIYFAAVLLIAGRPSYVLFLPIAVAAGTYIMYRSAAGDEKTMREGLDGRGGDDSQKATTLRNEKSEGSDKDSGAKACTKPSADNPFMNVLQSDYARSPDRGAACDLQDPAVARKSESLFVSAGSNFGLVRDSDDVFHRNASSRQFVTNPSTTIPNNQSDFAHWLYGTPPQCKLADRSGCAYRT